jgi:HSP20 family protein
MFVSVYRRPSVSRLEQEIESLFDGLLGTAQQPSSSAPAMDVVEYENEFRIAAALPGVRREDLKITVQDGVLSISGERKAPELDPKAAWLRRESSFGSFSRTLTLPRDVKPEEISAELTDGILRLTIPKAEAARPREITVK